jgi:hypothetical protein
MSTREYDFVTGIETSTQPTAGTPTDDNDTVNKGYADDTYAFRASWGDAVTSNSTLKAVASADRFDKQSRFNEAAQAYYAYDSGSGAADDGDAVLEPNDTPVTGRWIKITSGGGGGSGGASGVEFLMQKLELEKFGDVTEDLDNSSGVSGRIAPASQIYELNLIRPYTASDPTIDVVINAKPVLDADANQDSATGWAVTGAGATLTASSTAGDFQVGSAGLKFDKDNSGVEAGIRHTLAAQTLALGANTRAYANVKIPSLTNLSNLILRIYADTTSNFRTFTATTQADGSAFVVGWNRIFWDLSTGGTAGGTGWVSSQLAKYVEFAVTASSGAQTYTGIIVDPIYFSYRYPEELSLPGTEYTMFDNSNKEDIGFDATETNLDGNMALLTVLANSYASGLSGAARGRMKRSTITVGGNQAIFDSSLSSGDVALEQEIRIASFAREDVSGTFKSFVDFVASQSYKVTAVGGSTIDVDDSADDSANLLNGNTIEIYKPLRIAGKVRYEPFAARNLTANSSASAGTTTLTLTTAGIAVGDVVCKRHITQLALSVVGKTDDEVFTPVSLDASPDGFQLIEDGLTYPRSSQAGGHYTLGDKTSAEAVRNRRGTSPDLTIVGSPNFQGEGLGGRFAATGFSSSDYFRLSAADSAEFDVGNGKNVAFAGWFYRIPGVGIGFLAKNNNSNAGWVIYQDSSNNIIVSAVGVSSGLISARGGTAEWIHLAGFISDNAPSYFWVNNQLTLSADVENYVASASILNIGYDPGGGGTNAGLRIQDLYMVAGSGVTAWTESEINLLANHGLYKALGVFPRQRYMYTANSQSGQKHSERVRVARSTTAVNPLIWKTGYIKT